MDPTKDLLAKVTNLSGFFKGPIEIMCEKSQAKQEAQPVQPMPEEAAPPAIPAIEAATAQPQTGHQIPTSGVNFFLLIKPVNSTKGSRCYLLYAPPYFSIYNDETPELEILSPDTKFFVDGRFLTITPDRKFTIKSDIEIFDHIINSSHKSALVPYFLSISAAGKLPSPCPLTLPFTQKLLGSTEFLLMFSQFPEESLQKDLVDAWVRAADPEIDRLLGQLFFRFFAKLAKDKMKYPKSSFPFRVTESVLSMDEEFSSFCEEVSNSSDDPIVSFLSLLGSSNFNARSRMALHLLFEAGVNRFPEGNAAITYLSMSIFYGGADQKMRAKNLADKADKIEKLILFSQTATQLSYLTRYEKILTEFEKMPLDYIPPNTNYFAHDGMSILIEFLEQNVPQFLAIAREEGI